MAAAATGVLGRTGATGSAAPRSLAESSAARAKPSPAGKKLTKQAVDASAEGGRINPDVRKGLELIEQSEAKVKLNPKTPNQEGNITLDFGEGKRTNIRVETHPLRRGGPPVRHANIENVTDSGGRKSIQNRHIEE